MKNKNDIQNNNTQVIQDKKPGKKRYALLLLLLLGFGVAATTVGVTVALTQKRTYTYTQLRKIYLENYDKKQLQEGIEAIIKQLGLQEEQKQARLETLNYTLFYLPESKGTSLTSTEQFYLNNLANVVDKDKKFNTQESTKKYLEEYQQDRLHNKFEAKTQSIIRSLPILDNEKQEFSESITKIIDQVKSSDLNVPLDEVQVASFSEEVRTMEYVEQAKQNKDLITVNFSDIKQKYQTDKNVEELAQVVRENIDKLNISESNKQDREDKLEEIVKKLSDKERQLSEEDQTKYVDLMEGLWSPYEDEEKDLIQLTLDFIDNKLDEYYIKKGEKIIYDLFTTEDEKNLIQTNIDYWKQYVNIYTDNTQPYELRKLYPTYIKDRVNNFYNLKYDIPNQTETAKQTFLKWDYTGVFKIIAKALNNNPTSDLNKKERLLRILNDIYKPDPSIRDTQPIDAKFVTQIHTGIHIEVFSDDIPKDLIVDEIYNRLLRDSSYGLFILDFERLIDRLYIDPSTKLDLYKEFENTITNWDTSLKTLSLEEREAAKDIKLTKQIWDPFITKLKTHENNLSTKYYIEKSKQPKSFTVPKEREKITDYKKYKQHYTKYREFFKVKLLLEERINRLSVSQEEKDYRDYLLAHITLYLAGSNPDLPLTELEKFYLDQIDPLLEDNTTLKKDFKTFQELFDEYKKNGLYLWFLDKWEKLPQDIKPDISFKDENNVDTFNVRKYIDPYNTTTHKWETLPEKGKEIWESYADLAKQKLASESS